MSKLSRQIRNLVFVLVVVILSFACTIELLQIQIVDGEYYKTRQQTHIQQIRLCRRHEVRFLPRMAR